MRKTEQTAGCVAILGLGLMGGSLGLALSAAGRTHLVTGYDAAPGAAARAQARGAVDRACTSVAAAVAGADVVVLASPVLAMRELLRAVAPHLGPATVVTDLGSTKSEVAAWAEEVLPDPAHFVGGHPMAGSERSGIGAARADLYRGSTWWLTTSGTMDVSAAHAVTTGIIEPVGAVCEWIPLDLHDRAVAAISHLPLVAATALTLAAAQSPQWAVARRMAAGGFRDTTRVAAGDPRMARDICLTNQQPLVESLDAYISALQRLREHIAAHDPDIEETFIAAKAARDAWAAECDGAR